MGCEYRWGNKLTKAEMFAWKLNRLGVPQGEAASWADMSQMRKAFRRPAGAAVRCVGFAVGLLGVAALAACSHPAAPEGPAPAALAKADPMVTGLQPTAKGVRVLARTPEPDVAGDSIRAASRVARQIARAVQAGAADLPGAATVITLDV